MEMDDRGARLGRGDRLLGDLAGGDRQRVGHGRGVDRARHGAADDDLVRLAHGFAPRGGVWDQTPVVISARPLSITTMSRSTATARTETVPPSTQSCTRIVSPGRAGAVNRTSKDRSRDGSPSQTVSMTALPPSP